MPLDVCTAHSLLRLSQWATTGQDQQLVALSLQARFGAAPYRGASALSLYSVGLSANQPVLFFTHIKLAPTISY